MSKMSVVLGEGSGKEPERKYRLDLQYTNESRVTLNERKLVLHFDFPISEIDTRAYMMIDGIAAATLVDRYQIDIKIGELFYKIDDVREEIRKVSQTVCDNGPSKVLRPGFLRGDIDQITGRNRRYGGAAGLSRAETDARDRSIYDRMLHHAPTPAPDIAQALDSIAEAAVDLDDTHDDAMDAIFDPFTMERMNRIRRAREEQARDRSPAPGEEASHYSYDDDEDESVGDPTPQPEIGPDDPPPSRRLPF